MSPHRVAAYASIAVVAVAIAVGLYYSGPPSEQRLRRFDERRISDLQRLSAAVNGYYADNRKLPAALEEVVDGRLLSSLPSDPAAGTSYGYSVLGERRYELCAEFARESELALAGYWAHRAGRQCFDFDYSDGGAVPRLR